MYTLMCVLCLLLGMVVLKNYLAIAVKSKGITSFVCYVIALAGFMFIILTLCIWKA